MFLRSKLTLTLIILASLAHVPAGASIYNVSLGKAQRRQLPTVEQIVERFIKALGGRAAWLKIKSHYVAGTFEVAGTPTKGTYEVYLKGSTRSLTIMRLAVGGEIKTGFDGQRGWSQTLQNEAQYEPPAKQAAIKRDADFYKYLNFRRHFPNAKVTGIEEVEGLKAYLIEAIPAGEHLPERLYFDVRTGLLLLRETSSKDSVGKKTSDMMYYDDYREIHGIKVAYMLRIISGNTTIVTKHTEVKNNIAMDDAMFNLPVSK